MKISARIVWSMIIWISSIIVTPLVLLIPVWDQYTLLISLLVVHGFWSSWTNLKNIKKEITRNRFRS